MRTLQIETVTLADGSKMDVIRDIEAVRRALEAGENLARSLRGWRLTNGEMLCEADAKALAEGETLR